MGMTCQCDWDGDDEGYGSEDAMRMGRGGNDSGDGMWM